MSRGFRVSRLESALTYYPPLLQGQPDESMYIVEPVLAAFFPVT